MHKDFDAWNSIKKRIHNERGGKFYRERDIWWCSLGVNVGFEQDGKDQEYQRPVLILRGLSRDTCLVAPLTASQQEHRYRVEVGLVDSRQAKAIISQIKVIDTKRLVNKIGVLDRDIFEGITKSARDLL